MIRGEEVTGRIRYCPVGYCLGYLGEKFKNNLLVSGKITLPR